MVTLDFPPAKFEVEDQLKRILATSRFRNAKNPSDFLALGVTRALEGKKTTGSTIAKALFGGKFIQGESSDVRVTSRNLRAALQRYYEREGSNDVVIIDFPEPHKDKSVKPVEGKAYTPRFSYNPKHETYVFVRLAYRYLEQSMYGSYRRAFGLFEDILHREPTNIAAILGMVETLCKFADRHWENPANVPPIGAGINLLDRLDDRAESYWRFWAAKAYLYKSQGKDEVVASCYERALSLDRVSTESFFPYIEFLVEIQKSEEGLGLAQRYVNERIEDSTAVAQYGQFLYWTGSPEAGIGHLQGALTMDPGNCLAHETLAMIRFMERDVEGVSRHLLMLRSLCDAGSFERVVNFLESCEERYDMTGVVAKLLLQDTSGGASAIVKR
jgi:tetratricopeptide (TPR) repeat protein